MKFTLIATALLATVVFGEITEDKIKTMKPGNAGKMLIEIFKDEDRHNLLGAVFDLSRDSKARRGLLAKITGSQARSMKLDKLDIKKNFPLKELGLILSMSSDALKVFGLESTIKALKQYDIALDSLANFPLDFFKNEKFLLAIMDNLANEDDDFQDIFVRMSLEQFSKVMSNCPKFHKDKLTGASLNALAEELGLKKLKTYIAKVSPKFLDSIYSNKEPVPLVKAVVQALPVNFLNEIKVTPPAEEGQYYTDDQLNAYKKAKGGTINLSYVPPKKIGKVHQDIVRKAATSNGLTQEQINKLTVTQWNEILSKKAGCELIKSEIKLPKVSDMTFSPKCFAHVDPEMQAYILTRHTGLPDEILAYVTAEMVDKWSAKGDSGLDIIRHCSNMNVFAHIGAEVDEEDHPLNDLAPSKLAKKLKNHMAAITKDQLEVMKIGKPKSLADLRKDAEWVCYRDDIFETIDRMSTNNKRRDEKKQKVWPALTVKDIERLTGPKYSKLASGMTKDVFDRLQPAAAAAFAPRAIANLSFLKNLTNEQCAKFSADAFAFVSTSNTGKFSLAQATDTQLPLVSTQVKSEKSYFSAVQADEMQALGFSRLALLCARQWGALKPAVFKAVLVKTLVPIIPADSMLRLTAAQVSELSTEILSTLSAEQVALLGSDVADAKLSGRKVLLERKSELSSSAQAALIQSEQKAKQISGSAPVSTFSLMVVAATAGFALLL